MSSPVFLGQRVLYRLTADDVKLIQEDRGRSASHHTVDTENGPVQSLHHAKKGNPLGTGQQFPADVVAHFGGTTINLQVHLDGNDGYWATSKQEGDQPGQWSRAAF